MQNDILYIAYQQKSWAKNYKFMVQAFKSKD
jgi:hypothetical protein